MDSLWERPHNAASMRGYVMEAKPQCSRRRRAWLGYVAGSICTLSKSQYLNIVISAKKQVMAKGFFLQRLC